MALEFTGQGRMETGEWETRRWGIGRLYETAICLSPRYLILNDRCPMIIKFALPFSSIVTV